MNAPIDIEAGGDRFTHDVVGGYEFADVFKDRGVVISKSQILRALSLAAGFEYLGEVIQSIDHDAPRKDQVTDALLDKVQEVQRLRADNAKLKGMLVGNMHAAQDGYDIEEKLSAANAQLVEAVRVLGEECRADRNSLNVLNQFLPTLQEMIGVVTGTPLEQHAARLLMALRESDKARDSTDSHPTARAALNGEAPIDSR